jgi:CheY-like chemotaxis protein
MPSPPRPLRLLHVEDSEVDHDLTMAYLHHGGLQVEVLRIDTEVQFMRALEPSQHWSVIVSDYNLPGFSGLVALELLKKSGRNIPFILVSGNLPFSGARQRQYQFLALQQYLQSSAED